MRSFALRAQRGLIAALSVTLAATALVGVDSLAPRVADAATFTVVNTNDSGAGSLRDAITLANASSGSNTITFAIPGVGPHTITLLSALPALAANITIDGTSEPSYADTPLIELDGANVSSVGLSLTGGDIVEGLVVNRFGGPGIAASGSGNLILSNFVGTDASGTVAAPNAIGIWLTGGQSTVFQNVISGNDGNGVEVFGAAAVSDNLYRNLVGTNAAGSAAVANGSSGIAVLQGASGNTIGADGGLGNVVSGNGAWGIYVDPMSGGNSIFANVVGGDLAASTAFPNGVDGIKIWSGGNTITGNTVVGNPGSGIELFASAATANGVFGNFVGVTSGGTPLPNTGDGILIDGGASLNTVGALPLNCPSTCNTVEDNGGNGVEISNLGPGPSNQNAVRGNRILNNTGVGVLVQGGSVENEISQNSIAGNLGGSGDGIALNGGNNNQQPPEITDASNNGGGTTIWTTLAAVAATSYTVEWFSNPSCVPPSGQGETFLATRTLTTNSAGNGVVNLSLPASLGEGITATITDPLGNTSWFSQCRTVCSGGGTLPDPDCDGDIDFSNPGAGLPCIQEHLDDTNFDGYSDADELTPPGGETCLGLYPAGGGFGLAGLSTSAIDAPCPGRYLYGTPSQVVAAKKAKADVDLNGRVNILDLAQVAGPYGQTGFAADYADKRNEFDQDGNGVINILDFSVMIPSYNQLVPPC